MGMLMERRGWGGILANAVLAQSPWSAVDIDEPVVLPVPVALSQQIKHDDLIKQHARGLSLLALSGLQAGFEAQPGAQIDSGSMQAAWGRSRQASVKPIWASLWGRQMATAGQT